MVLGRAETKKEVLERVAGIKKAIAGALSFFRGLREGKGGFMKKSIPVLDTNGEMVYKDRWVKVGG
jgi:hypothetical protein